MKVTPKKINTFMMLKLPLAYLAGVRILSIENNKADVKIKHKWINQNPFKSMFWAAQGMAAELSTGVLVMRAIENSGEKVSMLVTQQRASFYKKATGKILFSCETDNGLNKAILYSKKNNEGKIIELTSKGKNEEGVVVAEFTFEWSLKVKQ
jgi:hypothetical protein